MYQRDDMSRSSMILDPLHWPHVSWRYLKSVLLSNFKILQQNILTLWSLRTGKTRSVDDSLLYVLSGIYSHLEKADSSVIRIMFYNFSSAFNTIQPHFRANRLMNMTVRPYTILWILNYLTNRPQFVKISCSATQSTTRSDLFVSDTVHTNTGCPQGTVLSRYLFSIYT